jgi:YD repeat-containing protein
MPESWTQTAEDGFKYEYDSSGDLVKMHNVAGATWTLSYVGTPPRLQSVLDPAGGRTTFTYDGSFKIEKITDPAGRETQLEVDENDNLVKHVTPELCTTSLTYDENHRLTRLIDPEGHAHTYTYDDSTRVTSYQNPLGYRTTLAYPSENVTEITNALGNVTTFQFNGSGNLERSEDALGHV